MAIDYTGQGFAGALQGALGDMWTVNRENQDQSYRNNYATSQFDLANKQQDQSNAFKNSQLAAQTAYLNAALQGNLGLGNRTLDSRTGLDNRGLDLQGTLGNRTLDIRSQEQANKLAVANSRNAMLEKLLGGFGNWFGGSAPATGGSQPPAGSPLGGAPAFSTAQHNAQPSGFTTNFGQSATYSPGPRQAVPPRPTGGAAPPPAAPVPPPAPPTGGLPPGSPPPGGPPAPGGQDPYAHAAEIMAALQARNPRQPMRYAR